MFSPRRTAQFALAAACLVLVSSITVLIAGASDMPDPSSPRLISRSTPLATGQVGAFQGDLAAHITIGK